jgi:hypothetical protein
MFIAPLKWLARFISIPVIQLIDGFVTGIKTFFMVIDDDALSPIQKATAVIAGFFGGLGSLISELVSFFGTLLGWVGKIPTLGWVGKIGEAVDWVAEKIDTHKLGEQTIDLMKTYNDGQAMGPEDNRTPKEIWRSSPKYQQASPEERKVLDERYSKALMTNKEKEALVKAAFPGIEGMDLSVAIGFVENNDTVATYKSRLKEQPKVLMGTVFTAKDIIRGGKVVTEFVKSALTKKTAAKAAEDANVPVAV